MVSHVDQIPNLLVNCLSVLNDDFSKSDYLEQFRNLETNVERVNFVYDDLKKHNLFFAVLEDRKDDIKATKLRKLGNKLFALQQYEKALKTYTCSIKLANNQKVLAMAYANRAACLHKLEMYNECQIDIERAMAHKKQSQFYENKKETLQQTKKNYEPVPKIPSNQKNPLIQCASDCIKIEQNEEFGRYIVATRDIRIGEVLSVEKPFVCTIQEEQLIHCHECMELCYNPIPCGGCTHTLYCSESCRERAFKKYHKYECSLLKSLEEYGMSSLVLSLRTTLLAANWYHNFDTIKFDKNEFYHSDTYKEVHCLHCATENRSVKDLFHVAVASASLFHLLQTTSSLFNQSDIEDSFKEILMLQIQISQCTVFAIYETLTKLDGYDNIAFATGLYPFSSLFNHSCCPNVIGTHYGSSMVLRAFSTIPKGQQCFITYGQEYGYESREERQMKLCSQYYFDCKCEACEGDWHTDASDPLLYKELQLASHVYDFIYDELLVGNVNVAKKLLSRCIAALENCEHLQPTGPCFKLRELLYICYCVFGSKRKL